MSDASDDADIRKITPTGQISKVLVSPSCRLTLPRHAMEWLGMQMGARYVLEEIEGGILIRPVPAGWRIMRYKMDVYASRRVPRRLFNITDVKQPRCV